MMSNPLNILGLISGSSLDGLDMALCTFQHNSAGEIDWKVVKSNGKAFPKSLQDKLSKATTLSAIDLFKLEHHFSKYCADLVIEFQKECDDPIDYVCSHGHTVYHFPDDGFTTQIGNGGIIAELCRIPTISDVRINDIAMGGQGAPIAPIVEKHLLKGYDFYLNLGGISNISMHDGDQILSFDSSSCNQTLNFLANKLGLEYDDNGALARQGTINDTLMARWASMPYFAMPHPKSLDNSWVRVDYNEKLSEDIDVKDALASSVEFCAAQLKRDIVKLLPESSEKSYRLLATGGGANNSYLIERIQSHLRPLGIEVITPDKQIVDYKEAILLALVGYLRVVNKPNIIATVTGAKRDTIGGALYVV